MMQTLCEVYKVLLVTLLVLLLLNMMKYKIYLDTNKLYNVFPIEEPFNEQIPELRKFLDEHNLDCVSICLPEIVIRERVQQKLETISEHINKINKSAESLKGVGHRISKVAPRKDYKKKLEEKVKDFLKENGVIRIKMPSIAKDDLIERAITKMKPFNDDSAGFKDTLIFLSIVEDALDKDTSVDHYIFCSNNPKDFTSEVVKEFEEKTGKNLHILTDITKVQETLDVLIPLNLHLEKRNKEIKELILKNIGDIMSMINRETSRRTNRKNNTSALSMISFYEDSLAVNLNSHQRKEEDIVGYNYENITFKDISELSQDLFRVAANLSTNIVYGDNKKDRLYDGLGTNAWSASVDLSTFQPNYSDSIYNNSLLFTPNAKNFSIYIDCDVNKNTISPHLGLMW